MLAISNVFKKRNSTLLEILLEKDIAPYWFLTPMMCLEFVTLFILLEPSLASILQNQIHALQLVPATSGSILLALLVIWFFIRLKVNVSIVRAFYIPVLLMALEWSVGPAILAWMLIIIMLISDVLSMCEYSFYSGGLLCQRHNSFKLYHYAANMLVLLIKRFANQYYLSAFIIMVYFGFFFMRVACNMNRKLLKKLFQIQYLALGVNRIVYLTQLSVYSPEHFFLQFCVILVIMQAKDIVTRREELTIIKLQESGNLNSKLYQVLCYILSSAYDPKSSQSLERFVSLNFQSFETDFNIKFDICSKREYLKIIEDFIRSSVCVDNQNNVVRSMVNNTKAGPVTMSLSNKMDYYDLLLLAQVEFKLRKNIFQAYRILRILQQKVPKIDFLFRICVYRVEQDIQEHMDYKFSAFKRSEYEDCMDNFGLTEMLFESTKFYRQLWGPIDQSEVVLERLEKLLGQVVDIQQIIFRRYKSLKYKAKETVTNYYHYCSLVEKDTQKAYKILDDLPLPDKSKEETFGSSHNDGSSSIFLQMNLENEDFGRILRVSPNVTGRLSYGVDELIGQSVDLFVPAFYRQHHLPMVKQLVNSMNDESRLYNFEKNTVCMDGYGNFLEAKFHFRVFMEYENQTRVTSIGYLKVQKSSDYWIVFQESTGKIIESRPQLTNEKGSIYDIMSEDFTEKFEDLDKDQQIFLDVETENLKVSLAFYRFKTYEVDGRRYSILKQPTDFMESSHIGPTGSGANNLTLTPASTKPKARVSPSVHQFLNKKAKMLGDELGLRNCLIRLSLIGLAVVGYLAFDFASKDILNSKKQFRSDRLDRLRKVQEMNLASARMYIWSHLEEFRYKYGLPMPYVNYDDLGPLKDSLAKIKITAEQIMASKLSAENVMVTEKMSVQANDTRKYNVLGNELLLSVASRVEFNQWAYRRDVLSPSDKAFLLTGMDYINANQQQLTIGLIRQFYDVLSSKNSVEKQNQLKFLVIESLAVMFMVILGLFICMFDRKIKLCDMEICVNFCLITNEDRYYFYEGIIAYISKMSFNGHEPFPMLQQGTMNSGGASRRFQGMSFMDSSFSPSPRINQYNIDSGRGSRTPASLLNKSIYSQKGTPRKVGNGSTSNLYQNSLTPTENNIKIGYGRPFTRTMRKFEDDHFQKSLSSRITQKHKKYSWLLVLALLLLTSSIVALSIVIMNESVKPQHSSEPYVDNALLLIIEPLNYLKQIEYFLRGLVSNYTDVQGFKSVLNEFRGTEYNVTKFDIGVLEGSTEFRSFIKLWSDYRYGKICTYLECTSFNQQLKDSTVENMLMQNSNYMQDLLLLQPAINQTISQQLATDPSKITINTISFLLYTESVVWSLAQQLCSAYFSSFENHNESIQFYYNMYQNLEMGLFLAILVFVAGPFCIKMVVRRKRSLSILDLIHGQSFKNSGYLTE